MREDRKVGALRLAMANGGATDALEHAIRADSYSGTLWPLNYATSTRETAERRSAGHNDVQGDTSNSIPSPATVDGRV